MGFRLVDRDYHILREIDRWRVITGKQICKVTGFSGQRACDRRLKKLIEAVLNLNEYSADSAKRIGRLEALEEQ